MSAPKLTRTGRAWKKRYFAEQWQEACEAAGITDLHFHDLRGVCPWSNSTSRTDGSSSIITYALELEDRRIRKRAGARETRER